MVRCGGCGFGTVLGTPDSIPEHSKRKLVGADTSGDTRTYLGTAKPMEVGGATVSLTFRIPREKDEIPKRNIEVEDP